MRFTHPTLMAAIDKACGSAFDVDVRAVGHNLRWDERLGPARVAAFQQGPFVPANDSHAALNEAYARVVHLPVDLRIEHIGGVDRLTTSIPQAPLDKVRDDHLEILRYETEREDFGEWLGDAR